jgi:hypothetical protein
MRDKVGLQVFGLALRNQLCLELRTSASWVDLRERLDCWNHGMPACLVLVRRAPKVAESRFLLLLLQMNCTESRVKLLVNSKKVTIHEPCRVPDKILFTFVFLCRRKRALLNLRVRVRIHSIIGILGILEEVETISTNKSFWWVFFFMRKGRSCWTLFFFFTGFIEFLY